MVEHWEQLFQLPPSVQRWKSGTASPAEAELAERFIERWRTRLLEQCVTEGWEALRRSLREVFSHPPDRFLKQLELPV